MCCFVLFVYSLDNFVDVKVREQEEGNNSETVKESNARLR